VQDRSVAMTFFRNGAPIALFAMIVWLFTTVSEGKRIVNQEIDSLKSSIKAIGDTVSQISSHSVTRREFDAYKLRNDSVLARYTVKALPLSRPLKLIAKQVKYSGVATVYTRTLFECPKDGSNEFQKIQMTQTHFQISTRNSDSWKTDCRFEVRSEAISYIAWLLLSQQYAASDIAIAKISGAAVKKQTVKQFFTEEIQDKFDTFYLCRNEIMKGDETHLSDFLKLSGELSRMSKHISRIIDSEFKQLRRVTGKEIDIK